MAGGLSIIFTVIVVAIVILVLGLVLLGLVGNAGTDIKPALTAEGKYQTAFSGCTNIAKSICDRNRGADYVIGMSAITLTSSVDGSGDCATLSGLGPVYICRDVIDTSNNVCAKGRSWLPNNDPVKDVSTCPLAPLIAGDPDRPPVGQTAVIRDGQVRVPDF